MYWRKNENGRRRKKNTKNSRWAERRAAAAAAAPEPYGHDKTLWPTFCCVSVMSCNKIYGSNKKVILLIYDYDILWYTSLIHLVCVSGGTVAACSQPHVSFGTAGWLIATRPNWLISFNLRCSACARHPRCPVAHTKRWPLGMYFGGSLFVFISVIKFIHFYMYSVNLWIACTI